jgi:hypothetical protein
MKGIDVAIFFSSSGGVGVKPGGGARPAGGVGRARLRCGRRKKVAGWAVRVGWASQEAEAQWGRGGKIGRLKKKRMGRGWAEKAGWAGSDGKNSFPNKI